MPQGKQTKILTPRQETALLSHLETTRYPERDRVLFLLALKAGMRAKEIAAMTWSMVTDAEGRVGDTIALENRASKGNSGRMIPMRPTGSPVATCRPLCFEDCRPIAETVCMCPNAATPRIPLHLAASPSP